jgi:cell division septation protein DedD
MNRIITILVTIFILLLLYIWISHVWGSDKPRHPRQIVDAREGETLGADEAPEDVDTSLLNDLTDDSESLFDETGSEVEEDPIVTEAEAEPEPEPVKPEPAKKPEAQPKNISPAVKEKPAESKPKETAPAEPKPTKTSQPIAKTAASDPADGKHMVIVGNFLQRVNAEQRMQELKKAGFENIEVVNFDLSEYHTVTAGRFDDVNEARRLVKKLKDYHKIDAYVRIGS